MLVRDGSGFVTATSSTTWQKLELLAAERAGQDNPISYVRLRHQSRQQTGQQSV